MIVRSGEVSMWNSFSGAFGSVLGVALVFFVLFLIFSGVGVGLLVAFLHFMGPVLVWALVIAAVLFFLGLVFGGFG